MPVKSQVIRVLIFSGSLRGDGSTARTLAPLREKLDRLGRARGRPVEAEPAPLGGAAIRPCRGCGACFDRGEAACPPRDGLLAPHDRIPAADPARLADRCWQGNGRFEPRCTFLFPHRAPRHRVLTARAIGGPLARHFAE